MAIVVGAALLRLPLVLLLPMPGDEAYFALWGRTLDWSYYDHPPMIALFVRAGTSLFGETLIGIRVIAWAAMTMAGWWLCRAAVLLFGSRIALAAVVWWHATLFAIAFGVVATPDTPLLTFWALGLYALARVARGERRAWLLFGVALGLALLSKYTALLLGIGAALWVLISPRQRHFLADPILYLAAALAFLIFSPVIWWNANHDWISFTFQAARAADSTPRGTVFILEHVGAQLGLATPLIGAAVGVAVYLAAWRGVEGDDRHLLLACLALPASLLFGVIALQARVQGNWPAPLYLAGVVAACAWLDSWGRRWLIVAPAALGLAIETIGAVHLATGFLPLPAAIDPRARIESWGPTLAVIREAARSWNAAFILTSDYRVTGQVGMALGREIPVIQFHQRPRFSYEGDPLARLAGRDGIMIDQYSSCRMTVVRCCAHSVTDMIQWEWPAPERPTMISRIRGLRTLMPPEHDDPQSRCQIPAALPSLEPLWHN